MSASTDMLDEDLSLQRQGTGQDSIIQAVRAWLIAATLPPDSPAETFPHTALNLFLCHLGYVRANHHALSLIVGIAGNRLRNVPDGRTLRGKAL